jgi:hypothetical protein
VAQTVGSRRVVADASELRDLASSARGHRAEVEDVERRAARIIASVDQTGWAACTALDQWPSVRAGLDKLAAELTTMERDLERRATLVDMLEQPFSSFQLLPPGLDNRGLAGVRALNVEWQRLLGQLPPGWEGLTRAQQLALLDQVDFGKLGYAPLPARPPETDDEDDDDGGGFSLKDLAGDALDGLKSAGDEVVEQGKGFGNQLADNVTGSVEGLGELGKAFGRDLLNGMAALGQGSTGWRGAPPRPFEGPTFGEVAGGIPGGFWEGVKEPFVDLANGRVGESAAGLISLLGLKGVKLPKLPKPPRIRRGDVDAPTGTVWDSIEATAGAYPRTKLPRSFNIEVGGEKFHVPPNATEHIYENLTRLPTTHSLPVATQIELTNLKEVIARAQAQGIRMDEMMVVDGWELKIGPPKNGPYPGIYHFQKKR